MSEVPIITALSVQEKTKRELNDLKSKRDVIKKKEVLIENKPNLSSRTDLPSQPPQPQQTNVEISQEVISPVKKERKPREKKPMTEKQIEALKKMREGLAARREKDCEAKAALSEEIKAQKEAERKQRYLKTVYEKRARIKSQVELPVKKDLDDLKNNNDEFRNEFRNELKALREMLENKVVYKEVPIIKEVKTSKLEPVVQPNPSRNPSLQQTELYQKFFAISR